MLPDSNPADPEDAIILSADLARGGLRRAVVAEGELLPGRSRTAVLQRLSDWMTGFRMAPQPSDAKRCVSHRRGLDLSL